MSIAEKQDLKNWLPTTKKELDIRGWDYVDVILFSGDAYVDHPSFGAAVIGRTLEADGLRVAIISQPNWRDDLRDFKKLGKPRLFFGVSAGAMDSMINHYTANKRLRSDDAYTPDNRAGMRPDYPTIVYTQILKSIYPDVPVVIGSIEASMRRFAHYDYWQDKFKKSILIDSGADILIYGMGEQPIKAIAKGFMEGQDVGQLTNIAQTAIVSTEKPDENENNHILTSFEESLKDKRKEAENFRVIEVESNRLNSPITLWQQHGDRYVKVNPPYSPMTESEIDESFNLPYTRLPHPKYRGKTISAYEMIKFSVNLHRGCFGGCAFCAIAAHQGKKVVSRSKESILNEVKKIIAMPDFKGYLSDLGGPSANMYKMSGKEEDLCLKCKRPSCIFPKVCKNLNSNHAPLLDIYSSVDALNGVKKSFIGSGIRYDMLLHRDSDNAINNITDRYTKEVITKHVSGRLKVAPEHTSTRVLDIMRKPSFDNFITFKRKFDKINEEAGLKQQLIPYFISSHPGCNTADMAELAAQTKSLDFHLEQVQDFTPTPMTLATEIFYTGINPYTQERVYTAHTKDEKLSQRQFFFWYKREERQSIERELRQIGREDLIQQLFGNNRDGAMREDNRNKRNSNNSTNSPKDKNSKQRNNRGRKW